MTLFLAPLDPGKFVLIDPFHLAIYLRTVLDYVLGTNVMLISYDRNEMNSCYVYIILFAKIYSNSV